MLLSTPFSAVTNAVIEACAVVVSGLIVKFVDVSNVGDVKSAAEAPARFKVTPLIAPVTILVALVALLPLMKKFASLASDS
jgi:hypothetical protein